MSTSTQEKRNQIGNVLTIMNQEIFNQEKEKRQLKKELQLNCAICRTVYQLLEIQLGKNEQCTDNCLQKWQQILQDYHSKELMVNLDKEDNE